MKKKNRNFFSGPRIVVETLRDAIKNLIADLGWSSLPLILTLLFLGILIWLALASPYLAPFVYTLI